MKPALVALCLLMLTGCATAGSDSAPPKKKQVKVLPAPINCTDDGKKCAAVIHLPDSVILIPINMEKLCIWRPA